MSSAPQRAHPTILLIGAGGLGGVILELLAREADIGVGQIVVCGRDRDRGVARCNLARLGAIAQGYAPTIRFVALDLTNQEAVAETIAREAPDIIVSTATLQTWWLTDLLPPDAAAPFRRAGFGMWLPVHLPLALRLMDALREARYGGLTLTAPFPDVVNCVLGRLGLAPTCGVGNLDEIVPKIRLLAARRLCAPLESVRVLLVAHHALEDYAFGAATSAPTEEIPPYVLRVECDGQDVTEQVEAHALLRAPCPLPPGQAIHFLTGGSTVRLVRALLSERGTLLHAPGPQGLPGGYPVIASRKGVRLAPIPRLSREEAIAVNEQSHRFDGIERIDPDGTVVFCSSAVEATREALGYECPRVHPREAESRAQELMAHFRAYAACHGVRLPS